MEILHVLMEQWVTVLIGALVLLLVYYWGTSKRRELEAAFPGVPGPKPLPFLGNLPDSIRHKGQFHLQFDEYYKTYGNLFSLFSFIGKPALVVCDPELIREILVKSFSSFRDRPVSNNCTNMLFCFSFYVN